MSGYFLSVMRLLDNEKGFYTTWCDLTYFDVFQLSFFVTAYVLPMVFMCVLYSIMLLRLWKTGPVGRASAESIRNKKRVVKVRNFFHKKSIFSLLIILILIHIQNLDAFFIVQFSACHGRCISICHLLASNTCDNGIESVETLC